MLKPNEPLGDVVKCLLIHMKSIQVRMQYTTHMFKGDSKHKVNLCINKVEAAINGIIALANNPEMTLQIKKALDKADLVYHMVLAEQLYDINEETLVEITDLIDDYLLKKTKAYEEKEQMGRGDSSQNQTGIIDNRKIQSPGEELPGT